MLSKKCRSILITCLITVGSIFLSSPGVNAAGKEGWFKTNGTWHYYKNGTMLKNSWQHDSKGWCFLSELDGSLVQEGWAKDSKGWVYIQNGYWVQHSTWAKDSKGWVYIGDNGYWDGKPAVAAQPTTPKDSTSISRGGNMGIESASSLTAYAKSFSGTPYLWGGTTPDGFDCSGFVQFVYKHYGISLNRIAADQQLQGTAVNKDKLQPGDLVFFGSPATHVGIYMGNGYFIHASYSESAVKTSPLSNMSDYSGARRILN